MTKIVLLRHGESIWNKENLFTGWTDVDLSEQGKAEAKRAGELLKAEGSPSTSPLPRCSSGRSGRSGSRSMSST